MSPELVFLHIPKAAGTSQHGSFRQYYGPENIFWFGEDCPADVPRYPRDLIGERPIVGGHKPLSFYPAEMSPLFCAVLRDPIERAISLFAYYTQPGLAGEELGRVAREKTLSRLLSEGIDPDSMVNSIKRCKPFRREIANLQCAYLSRTRGNFPSARRSLVTNDFVLGTVSEYGRFHDYLGELLLWPPEQPGSKNRGRNDYASEYLRDEQLLELIREINKEDYKLLDYISGEHGGLYVHYRDESTRRDRLSRLPLKPWRNRRFGSDWEAAAETLWPRRSRANRLVWPLGRLMLAKPGKILYQSIPGPANGHVSRLMLQCAQLENASAVQDLGLGRVTANFVTGLMLADQDPEFARSVRTDSSYFKFAVIYEPVSRLVDIYATHFVEHRSDIPVYPKRGFLARTIAEIQGRAEPDIDRGICFREFVSALVKLPHRRQPALWIPQYLFLKGVDHYDKLFREDQLELIVSELAQRSGVEFHLDPGVLMLHSPSGKPAVSPMTCGDYADVPAGDLPNDSAVWRSQLVDEALYNMITDYYDEDRGLYDGTAVSQSGRRPA